MSEYELTPIVDKNGVHTHRYQRPRTQASADLQNALSQVPLRLAGGSDEENAFADVACSSEVMESSEETTPPCARFQVLLEHGSGRSMSCEYRHLSTKEPQARDVLAYLAVQARSARYSVDDLSLRLGYPADEAQALHDEANKISADLHAMLGSDYEAVTEAALEQDSRSLSVRPIAVSLHDLASRMRSSAHQAYGERDVEAYAVLRVLGRDVGRSAEAGASADEVDTWLGDLERQTSFLYSQGSLYGWVAETYAQQLRVQLGVLRNEQTPLRSGRRADEVPEMAVLVKQMRQEESSLGSLDDPERQRVQAWSSKLEEMIASKADATEVMREVAAAIQQAQKMNANAGGSVLYGYAIKVCNAIRA